ncbi:aminoglycoside phosphotransferase family protein [Pseudonocardia sp.]|uniref:aminoglycoside phosphotransferase family protein n=1 Tax=Pseudonocardia sp. TaxID=60912 RepID=UPI00260FDED4|nr:aminoglycoside phosphotransferase family protein [Pseudonocardia sp.]
MIADSADQAILDAACSAIDLDDGPVTLLKKHATGIYLHEPAQVVMRVSRGKERERGRTAVAIARWLNEQDFPATEPLDVVQPFDLDDASVTFWHYYPQGDRPAPEPAALGTLLRQLHRLPEPPISLASYRPLVRLGAAQRADHLPDDDRQWLGQRRSELLADYDRLESELGHGFIHGDAYPGNVLWDGDRPILGDWDEIARGPRELDLVNTHQGARFGRSAADRAAFTDAYGWDVTSWPGFSTLRAMRDLHTLAVFIERAAAGDEPASAELRHRIATLQLDQPDASWQSA